MPTTSPRDTLVRQLSAGLCCALVAVFVWGIWLQTAGLEVWTFDGLRQRQIAAKELQAPVVQLRYADEGSSVSEPEPAPWSSGAPAAYLVDFIYTRCPDVCRSLGSEYQQMQRELIAAGTQDPAFDRVRLLSVSFDLEHDTVPELHHSARLLSARPPHWRWAVPANEAGSRRLLRALGVVAIPDGASGFVHNGDIHLLDRDGKLRGLFNFEEWQAALVAARELAAQ